MKKEIFNLQNLINYQKGSVVSREIIKKPTGSITIFAFDKDQGLSEHTAPFDAFVQIIEGEADIKISGIQHNLKSGDAIIMPAGESHELKAVERFKMVLVMIKS